MIEMPALVLRNRVNHSAYHCHVPSACLSSAPAPVAHRRGKLDWLTPTTPGPYTLLARAKDAGARIIEEPADQDYGYRRYGCVDPQGHEWYFAQRLAEEASDG